MIKIEQSNALRIIFTKWIIYDFSAATTREKETITAMGNVDNSNREVIDNEAPTNGWYARFQ